MSRRLAAAMLLAASLAIASCAVQGRPFEPAPASRNEAVIYVYRPYSYAGSLLRPSVTCGDETARIGPGGYHAFVVPPGKVVCSVQAETEDEVEIDAAPITYYIKEMIIWGVLTGHPQLNPIDTDQAPTEIQQCCVLER